LEIKDFSNKPLVLSLYNIFKKLNENKETIEWEMVN
jgi:hypothetical protein